MERLDSIFTGAEKPRLIDSTGRTGYCFVHSAVDDRSRLAYSEIHDDEKAATTTAFWTRAIAFYASHGVQIREVISDNGPNYRSRDWNAVNSAAGITVLRTRPYRPHPGRAPHR